ncbi:hypothetical protein B0H13DRAFT_2413248 [Mycena leptocephala]|nr:hypothetical protein B0H13DRAFT_2413248 [Mycena leptocephala]
MPRQSFFPFSFIFCLAHFAPQLAQLLRIFFKPSVGFLTMDSMHGIQLFPTLAQLAPPTQGSDSNKGDGIRAPNLPEQPVRESESSETSREYQPATAHGLLLALEPSASVAESDVRRRIDASAAGAVRGDEKSPIGIVEVRTSVRKRPWAIWTNGEARETIKYG